MLQKKVYERLGFVRASEKWFTHVDKMTTFTQYTIDNLKKICKVNIINLEVAKND